eukprot:Hpha_TRINITY_DN14524_c0_g1::TRINITY_DN14524_c0_g1_i1::g.46906::m.46906/K17914/KIF13; kinesin family member 13
MSKTLILPGSLQPGPPSGLGGLQPPTSPLYPESDAVRSPSDDTNTIRSPSGLKIPQLRLTQVKSDGPSRRRGVPKRTPRGLVEEEYKDLRVRHSPLKGTWVDGLTTLVGLRGQADAEAVKRVIRHGVEHRATAATNMNAASSRSHAVFQIIVMARNDRLGMRRYAHLNLVDLAGSERVKLSGVEGDRFVEAKNVNLSLSTLRRVIDVMIENSSRRGTQKRVVPYRESMLTWILSESLGGNSKTTMLAAVSPHESSREDTVNTLRYAVKASAIVNTVRANEEKCSVLLSAMQREIEKLRSSLQDGDSEAPDRFNELVRDIAQRTEEREIMARESQAIQGEVEKQREQLNMSFNKLMEHEAEVDKLRYATRRMSTEKVVLAEEIHKLSKTTVEHTQKSQEAKQTLAELRRKHHEEKNEAERVRLLASVFKVLTGSVDQSLEAARQRGEAAGLRATVLQRQLSEQRHTHQGGLHELNHGLLRLESAMASVDSEYRLLCACSNSISERTSVVSQKAAQREEALGQDYEAAEIAFDELTSSLREVHSAVAELDSIATRRAAELKQVREAAERARMQKADANSPRRERAAIQRAREERTSKQLAELRESLEETKAEIALERARCDKAREARDEVRGKLSGMREEVENMTCTAEGLGADLKSVRQSDRDNGEELVVLRLRADECRSELESSRDSFQRLRAEVVREYFPTSSVPTPSAPPRNLSPLSLIGRHTPGRGYTQSPSPPRRVPVTRLESGPLTARPGSQSPTGRERFPTPGGNTDRPGATGRRATSPIETWDRWIRRSPTPRSALQYSKRASSPTESRGRISPRPTIVGGRSSAPVLASGVTPRLKLERMHSGRSINWSPH